MSSTELPNIGQIVGQVLQRVAAEHQPLLIAIAERLAAQRYRSWAKDSTMNAHSARLLACADREEEIASRVEGLYPDAAAVQHTILAANPDFQDINRTIFTGRPLAQQFTIQAQGERLGAATWRAFARREEHAARRSVLSSCAELEEESALVLESILGIEQ
jgi:hypothetical protein